MLALVIATASFPRRSSSKSGLSIQGDSYFTPNEGGGGILERRYY